MNKRLQQFLDAENLTPARLADMMGIQRSGMSHILSARNKPSYDFIYNLLSRFPALNAEWLITGKGRMYKNSDGTPQTVQPQPPVIDDFPEDDFPADEQDSPSADRTVAEVVTNSSVPQASLEVSKPKYIKRITVFYSDGTFEEK